jgi:hypothetical protein
MLHLLISVTSQQDKTQLLHCYRNLLWSSYLPATPPQLSLLPTPFIYLTSNGDKLGVLSWAYFFFLSSSLGELTHAWSLDTSWILGTHRFVIPTLTWPLLWAQTCLSNGLFDFSTWMSPWQFKIDMSTGRFFSSPFLNLLHSITPKLATGTLT